MTYEAVVSCTARGCDVEQAFHTRTPGVAAPAGWTWTAAGFRCPQHSAPNDDD